MTHYPSLTHEVLLTELRGRYEQAVGNRRRNQEEARAAPYEAMRQYHRGCAEGCRRIANGYVRIMNWVSQQEEGAAFVSDLLAFLLSEKCNPDRTEAEKIVVQRFYDYVTNNIRYELQLHAHRDWWQQRYGN